MNDDVTIANKIHEFVDKAKVSKVCFPLTFSFSLVKTSDKYLLSYCG